MARTGFAQVARFNGVIIGGLVSISLERGHGRMAAGAVPSAGVPSLQGRFRQRRAHHRRLQFHRDGGRLLDRHLLDPRFDPRPVRLIETDDVRGFGEYSIGLQSVNQRGEESTELASLILFLAPAPLSVSNQQLSGYDPQTDVATFSCTHDTLR